MRKATVLVSRVLTALGFQPANSPGCYDRWMVMKAEMLAVRQAGTRHIHSPREGLLEGEQSAPDVLMPPGGICLLVLQAVEDVFLAK